MTGTGRIENGERELADAALRLSIRTASPPSERKNVVVVARAVNSEGYVLWPASRRGIELALRGSVGSVARRIVSDLAQSVSRSASGSPQR
jgi:hypothetical protein